MKYYYPGVATIFSNVLPAAYDIERTVSTTQTAIETHVPSAYKFIENAISASLLSAYATRSNL